MTSRGTGAYRWRMVPPGRSQVDPGHYDASVPLNVSLRPQMPRYPDPVCPVCAAGTGDPCRSGPSPHTRRSRLRKALWRSRLPYLPDRFTYHLFPQELRGRDVLDVDIYRPADDTTTDTEWELLSMYPNRSYVTWEWSGERSTTLVTNGMWSGALVGPSLVDRFLDAVLSADTARQALETVGSWPEGNDLLTVGLAQCHRQGYTVHGGRLRIAGITEPHPGAWPRDAVVDATHGDLSALWPYL